MRQPQPWLSPPLHMRQPWLWPPRARGCGITSSALAGAADPLGGYTPETLLSAPKNVPLDLYLHVADRHTRLKKAPGESVEHLLLKGLLWALLLPAHPDAACEADLGLRYRPDVVALDSGGAPVWWGECGSVTASKLSNLAGAYPACRISVCKFGRSDLRGYAAVLRSQLELSRRRAAPFDLISFPADSAEKFLRADGSISISFDDLDVTELSSCRRKRRARRGAMR